MVHLPTMYQALAPRKREGMEGGESTRRQNPFRQSCETGADVGSGPAEASLAMRPQPRHLLVSKTVFMDTLL